MLNLTLDKRNLVFVDILLTVPKTFSTEENAQSMAMIISATSKMCPNFNNMMFKESIKNTD